MEFHIPSETALQGCSYKMVISKYETSLQENTYAEIRFA